MYILFSFPFWSLRTVFRLICDFCDFSFQNLWSIVSRMGSSIPNTNQQSSWQQEITGIHRDRRVHVQGCPAPAQLQVSHSLY